MADTQMILRPTTIFILNCDGILVREEGRSHGGCLICVSRSFAESILQSENSLFFVNWYGDMRYLPRRVLAHRYGLHTNNRPTMRPSGVVQEPVLIFYDEDLIPITARLKDDLLQSEQEFGKGLASPDTTADPDADHEADHDKP